MKKIVLIILMMIVIGCESKNATAVEYPIDDMSSSIDIMSSSSENISMSSDAVNSSSSINSEISSSLSSSSLRIISSSSISRSSSSSFKISSSSYNQISNSSSSTALKSSDSISNSSSSQQSSSSEIANHTSNIFLFDLDSALTNAYFKTMNGDDSPLYEVVANRIMQYKSYYGWDTIATSKSITYDNGYFLTKTFATIINGMIQDRSSAYLESIDINYHKYGTTYTVMRLRAKEHITDANVPVLFEASEVITVNGYKTFILRRNAGNEISCNWYSTSEGKWKTAGFNAMSSQAGYNSKCNIVAVYGLND